MPVRIENQTCYFKVNEDGQEHSLQAADVTVSTDIPKAMSYVQLDADRVYITEQEADALTVAGAIDGRQHKRVTEPGSAI
jgi:NAD kinase